MATSTSIFRQLINSLIPTNNQKLVKASSMRQVLESGATAIDDIFKTISIADGLGTYNPATGIATIRTTGGADVTYTPVATADQPNGKYFDVIEEGTNSITGAVENWKKEDKLISRGTKWDRIPAGSGVALEKIENYEAKIILTEDGRFLIKGDGDWIGFELTPAGVTRTGPIEVASIKIDGSLLDITQFAEKAVFNRLNNNFGLVEDGEFKFVDQYGNSGGIISSAGLWTLANMVANAITSKQVTAEKLTAAGLIFQNENPAYKLVFTDELGNIGLDLTPKIPRITGQQYDVNHAIWYGQSNAHQQGTTPVTTTSTPFVITFNKGPYIFPFLSDPTTFDSFRDSTENYYETPCTPAGKMIKQMINSRGIIIDGTTFVSDTLVSASSRGGWSLTNLSKGTEDYNRLLATVTSGKSLANAQGKTYGVTCINWMQGEAENTSGMPAPQYKDLLRKLRIDLNADIKAITGQKQEVFFLLWQCASFNMNGGYADISLAMLDMALNEDFFFMGPTMYPYRYAADQIHFATDGQEGAKIGSYQGYLIDQIQNLGKDWLPIHVKETRISGSMLDVQFHVPVQPLVLDTVAVTDPGNKGFRLFNSAGVEQTITEARLVRPDTVRIVSSAAILPGMKLTYALNGDANKSGWNAGARGCLRDSQGETIIYDPAGRNIKLHNWCPIFSHILK